MRWKGCACFGLSNGTHQCWDTQLPQEEIWVTLLLMARRSRLLLRSISASAPWLRAVNGPNASSCPFLCTPNNAPTAHIHGLISTSFILETVRKAHCGKSFKEFTNEAESCRKHVSIDSMILYGSEISRNQHVGCSWKCWICNGICPWVPPSLTLWTSSSTKVVHIFSCGSCATFSTLTTGTS